MILATHILGAAALTQPIASSGSLALFLGAIASHYVLDAIPHRDYTLDSVIREGDGRRARVLGIDAKKLLRDIFKLLCDGVAGVVILFFLIQPEASVSGLAPFGLIILGAVLPDILQFVFWFFPKGPMPFIHRFHRWVHVSREPRGSIGFIVQIILIVMSILFLV